MSAVCWQMYSNVHARQDTPVDAGPASQGCSSQDVDACQYAGQISHLTTSCANSRQSGAQIWGKDLVNCHLNDPGAWDIAVWQGGGTCIVSSCQATPFIHTLESVPLQQ